MMDSSLEIRGTDTPPEKVPRQVFPATFQENENNGGSSLFSSIMHKFVKIDDREKSTERCLLLNSLFFFFFSSLGFYLVDAYLID